MKKLIVSLLGVLCITGCSDISSDTAYLNGKEEVAFIQHKDVYTCKNDEFFYVESNRQGSVNFIYGNYSTPLAQKPSVTEKFFSDGVYNLVINNGIAKVFMDNEVVLDSCTKS